MTDETIVNYNVPGYTFGTETYTRIGLTSNGYAVVGGGTSQDVDYIPQNLPDPARPNNVLAPFWTDLNMADGGALRVGILAGGGLRWLIADWEGVPVWGTGGTVTNSFQVWIGLNGIDDISYGYGPISGHSSDGLTVGAENRDGTSGAMLGAVPAEDDAYVIETSGPTAGGTVTITYDALGTKTGTYDVTASLTSNLANGATVKTVTLTVE
jgi:hypothetical protein